MGEENQNITTKIITTGPKKFDTRRIIQCLLRDANDKTVDEEEFIGRPSVYMKHMSMTTEERTQHILKCSNRLDLPFCVKLQNNHFEVSPSVVIFQQFTPGVCLNVIVSVRNVTKVSKYLRHSHEPDPFFSVEYCGNCYSTMLAPGLCTCFKVKFMPDRNCDYHYQFKFLTDTGELIVPVLAIGPRGILDFPDHIEIPSTAVKISSLKTIFVRNVGNAAAVFTLYTDNTCFWIEPSKGAIQEEESLQFTVNFLSSKAGDFQAILHLDYDTGEKLGVNLRCSAENVPVRIDRGSVRVEETFLGLSRSKAFTIHNRSDYIVKYKWMLFESVDADDQRKAHYRNLYQLVYESELNRFVHLAHYDVCTPDIHQLVYQRIYADELESLTKESFQYNNSSFAFTPEEGEIWPQSSIEVTVFFRALEVGEVTSTAYLEVSGREDRIPLSLHGTVKGPVLRLNVLTIDLENIYMCSLHNYEIVVANNGHIPGTLVYREKPSDFGGTINVTPPSLHLQPDKYKSFNLSFSSNRKGDFVERIDFVVKESLEVLSLHIKGCIICPTLHFDKECIDFGTTALGFSSRQDVYLHNLSLIAVAFTITVLNDGDHPPLAHEEFARAHIKPSFPSNPREFHVVPEEGVVAAQGALKIKVIYTANIARAGKTTIQVDMWDTDANPVTLPVKFNGRVASLSIVPEEIALRFCFINFPYTRSFTVENQSDQDGYFYLPPQPLSEDSPVICSLSTHQGFVKARTSKTINASVITRVMGKQRIVQNMLTMGEPTPTSSCVILCNGQGAVVSTEPSSLNFGEVKVLEQKTMDFVVFNDSPIPAHFNATLEKKKSPWTISPESGDLEANTSTTMTVTLMLRDVGKYADNVVLSVVNSRTIAIDLKAIGFGCSVVFEPTIFPVYDWGLLFSHQKIERTINLTNRGTRDYQIIWTTAPEVQLNRGQILLPKTAKFHLHPSILNIPPGDTKHVTCTFNWKVNECVTEDWYVFGQIQGAGKRELIGTSCFKVTLTEPQILFSKTELTFRVDVCPRDLKLQQIDELLVTNRSELDIDVQVSVKEPFRLITSTEEHVQSMRIVLIDGATTTIRVFFYFDSSNGDLRSKSYSDVLRLEYDQHPNQDKISCKGYVNFPNLVVAPKDVTIDCELGLSAERILTLTNNGPVPCVYKFLWIAESIDIEQEYRRDCCDDVSPDDLNLELNAKEVETSLVVSETKQGPCISGRQDGSGDGPLNSITAPANSPISEDPEAKPVHNIVEKASVNDDGGTVSDKEIRKLLLPLVEGYFKADDDLIALESISCHPPKKHYINEVLEIVPSEGTVLPYSVQYVHVGFHGFERLRVKAAAVCEVMRGPNEQFRIQARADALRYSINIDVIDFKHQLFLERIRKSFTLWNLCGIAFEYKVQETRTTANQANDPFDLHPLTIQPNRGVVEARSFVEFLVDHVPTTLGPIHRSLQLEIGHLMPVTMEITACGSFPQVYPRIPHGKAPQYHSIEMEYIAIQSLSDNLVLDLTGKNVDTGRKNVLQEADTEILTAEGWSVIPIDETFPRIMDIDMAVERHFAKSLIDANSYILMQYAMTTRKQAPIPQLYSFEYVIDMNYVPIGSMANFSTEIVNYGTWNADLRMKTKGSKVVLAKEGITVQLSKNSRIQVGDSAILNVTWHPTQDNFSEKSTEVNRTVYIEVVHGCTIPVTVTGIVAYRYITVNTTFLDFQDVVVGECLALCVLVKNEGLFGCKWKTKIANVSRQEETDYPFYVEYDSNYCPPGHAEVLRVFFKPRKTCYVRDTLEITVPPDVTKYIMLTGRGIEKSLNIIEPTIEFRPCVPFTQIQEVNFVIENACYYPVEFFWHHLDNCSQAENYVTKALLRYYNVEEILLPPRMPGEPLPSELIRFYNDTVAEMALALAIEKDEEEERVDTMDDSQEWKSFERPVANRRTRTSLSRKRSSKLGKSSTRQFAVRRSSVRGSSRRGMKSEILNALTSSDSDTRDCKDLSTAGENALRTAPLPTSDPEEIQRLLYRYIDDLRKAEDFRSRMKDPVKEVFQSIERKSNASRNLPDPTRPEKRVCVIFHGAPFTEYQEAACRSAKALDIAVLNIDKAITEVIALSGTACSIQLRQIVDDAYESYAVTLASQRPERRLTESESRSTERTESRKGKDRSPADRSSKTGTFAKSPRTRRTSKPVDTTDGPDTRRETVLLRLPADPDPLNELDKIPIAEKLEMLDPLSRYEYKIQAILLSQKMVTRGGTRSPKRDKSDRSAERKEKATFLGIANEVIAAALGERLAAEDFKRGFVVQSLDSIFLRDDATEALIAVLRTVGHVEYLLFVSFLNSMALYEGKSKQLQREIAEKELDQEQKIRDIDEMSASEFDQLPDEDKKMYLDAILPAKMEEASRRRALLMERMAERMRKKNIASGDKKKGSAKSKKNEKASGKKSSNSKPPSSKRDTSKGTKSRDSSARRKEVVPNEVKEVMAAMNRYYADLSSIEHVIRYWDPIKRTMHETAATVAKSKASKSGRSKDTGRLDSATEPPANNFHTWYIRSSDPWNDSIYNMVVSQMRENSLAKSALPVEIIPEPDLRPRVYTVLKPKHVERRKTRVRGDVYQLVSLTPVTQVPSVNDSVTVSELSVQEYRTETRAESRRRLRKSTRKTNEYKSLDRSLNASTIESKDTFNVSPAESIVEEPLKPRCILLPNETQWFKVRFQPEQAMHYQETYALTVLDGTNLTYEVNVTGIADVPRLELELDAISTNDAFTYVGETRLCDFGSMVVLRKDQRPHRRELRLKFCNVSKVEAEARVLLAENSSECFSVQPEQLLIPPGKRVELILSAVANKLGINTGKLYTCVKNNPKIDVIQLQCEGTKLDIELEGKEIVFGKTLLYRCRSQFLTIRNKTPVAFYWYLEAEKPDEPQLSFTPSDGAIEPRSETKIEFCYRGVTAGVIKDKAIIFKAFLYDINDNPIFTDVVRVSGSTYDVMVDILDVNPIDLGCIKVDVPVSAAFTMRNRGDYEVKYVITLQEDNKLAELNLSANFKKHLEVEPASGTVQPKKTSAVKMVFTPKIEMSLKESPILKCHLVDTNEQTVLIAEIPLNVSLIAYYIRFQVHPYPTVNFGTLAICTEKTMYLNIENIGKFPLRYAIKVLHRKPSMVYMSQTLTGDTQKKRQSVKKDKPKKGKQSARSEITEIKSSMEGERLTIGPMTITKMAGEIDIGATDSIAINCYPEFVGAIDEQIKILVEDTVPEDKDGRIVTLYVNSIVPSVDFHDIGSMFQENHVVDRIQDFDCPKEIGPHTVFARQEQCLYFRYVSVMNTHVTCFKLHNRGIVAANVEAYLVEDTSTSSTPKLDTFSVEPRNEEIPPMSHKVFTISFTPHSIETFETTLRAIVALPSHLDADQLYVKLIGESCVPEVVIREPVHGTRERPILNFARTLIEETSCRYFAMENVGVIKAKVIVEIDEDQGNVFSFSTCPDSQQFLQIWDAQCDESHDRCTVVRLSPGDVARFKAKFSPKETGRHFGKVRLHVVDNPYENLTISLAGECYVESIVLDGLPFEDGKRKSRESYKLRKASSKQNSVASATITAALSASLTYLIDYGLCFIGRMYKKTFRIANKSTDRLFRFQWSAHPHVVFVPSIGHLKYLTSKEIVATFLATEPTNHANTRIDCTTCEIVMEDQTSEVTWDDRQTEVRWEKVHHGATDQESEFESLVKKIVEPAVETKHQVVPGTSKTIQILLNATVAYSEYQCSVQEVHFKDTLMFQTRKYTFTLSNPGPIDAVYAWKIDMDEQFPKRHVGDGRRVTSRPRTAEDGRSHQYSRSSRGISSATNELRRNNYDLEEKSAGGSVSYYSQHCTSFATDSYDVKGGSSARKSDLFSSTAGMSERTTDSWLEGDDMPFTIHPETGTIPPQQSIECTLKFSPKDVFYYKAYLTCKLENLDPELPNLTIPVVARSLLPYCHFDVQESDYVTSGRRDPKRSGPVGYEIDDPVLWQNIRVIEFKVVGIGGTHVKKFHLINPTTDDYRFSWTDRTLRGTDEISNFHCVVTEGIAERGKQTDLAFTFLAEDVGVFESFWLFSIDRYNLECLFLIVGVVTEPSIHCLTVHAKLKPTILGYNVRDSIRLLNNEDFHIPFKVIEESLYSEGKFQKLNVTPMTGSLSAKGEQLIWIEYHPSRVGEFHFSVQCAVKLMKNPLTVFVTASVYEIASSVSYCKPNGETLRAFEDKENVIDLGKLMLDVPTTVKFEIINSCKVTFYYTWEFGMTPDIACRNAYNVTMAQKQGHVTSEDRCTCNLTLTTFQKIAIKDHCVSLKISNGPLYKFVLKALCKKPAIQFSFARYDFGPCYIQDNSAVSYYTELRVTNSDDSPFVVECNFEEQPYLSVGLNVISEAVAARSTTAIPIVFRPMKEIKYQECLVFTINSVNEKRITITGEGIRYKIRLVNPRDKSIDLGSVPVNRSVTKKIPVLNEGLAPVELRFDLMKNLSGYEKHRERLGTYVLTGEDPSDLLFASVMETKRSWTLDQRLETIEPLLSDVLTITPSSNVVLKRNARINVLVTFKPTYRMRPFAAKVALQTASTIIPLFMVRGSCVGAEFRLNRTRIPFGTVVEGCTEETKVTLMNTGDLGSRFKWNASKLPAEFQIGPLSGYCSAGMDVSFLVKFQPSEQRSLIEGEATLEIEKYEPLSIKITGTCCKLPEPLETIAFETFAREKQVQKIVVMNDKNLPWKLTAEVTGDYFSVDGSLQIPPQGFGSCVVTYAPLVMSAPGTVHTGTLLLKPLDENSILLYSLRGSSLPPQAAAQISRRFPAKTKYTELLPVRNWLNVQQRFRCDIQLLKDDDAPSETPLYSFIGNERIDVPANGQRDYRAVFFCYVKSNFYFKVTFTNDEEEYQFYEIVYEVTEPEVIESVKMKAPARSTACHTMKLENPLERDAVEYTAECDHPFVTVGHMPKTVAPLSYEYVHVQYQPMLPCDESVMLIFRCSKLGEFPYELQLKATDAPPEKVTRVSATLGSFHKFSLPVRNSTNGTATFTVHVDNDCFTSQDSFRLQRWSNGAIDVIYEPCDVENVTATLTASSDTAGEFVFPLVGSCSLPKPMGPYVVSRGAAASIGFKNVFREVKNFDFLVDAPDIFEVQILKTTLNSKENIDIEVYIRETEGEVVVEEDRYSVTGKLTVYCTDPAFSHVNWVYYLRAVFE